MMEDRQQAPCMYDVFGNEIYEGGKYYVSNEGNIAAAPPSENYDIHNALLQHLVETFGVNHIAEMCGLEKKVYNI